MILSGPIFVVKPGIGVGNFGSVEHIVFEMLADGDSETNDSDITLEARSDLFDITIKGASGEADVEQFVEGIADIFFLLLLSSHTYA